jgi:hypothetical protein
MSNTTLGLIAGGIALYAIIGWWLMDRWYLPKCEAIYYSRNGYGFTDVESALVGAHMLFFWPVMAPYWAFAGLKKYERWAAANPATFRKRTP